MFWRQGEREEEGVAGPHDVVAPVSLTVRVFWVAGVREEGVSPDLERDRVEVGCLVFLFGDAHGEGVLVADAGRERECLRGLVFGVAQVSQDLSVVAPLVAVSQRNIGARGGGDLIPEDLTGLRHKELGVVPA